jgi:maltose O-acetyltransferase
MLAGELYMADDPELFADMQRAAALMEMFNASMASDTLARRAILQ